MFNQRRHRSAGKSPRRAGLPFHVGKWIDLKPFDRVFAIYWHFMLSAILGIFTLPLLFWSIVCFLGGPDGRTGSAESIFYGLLCFTLSFFCLRGCIKWLRKGKLFYNETK